MERHSEIGGAKLKSRKYTHLEVYTQEPRPLWCGRQAHVFQRQGTYSESWLCHLCLCKLGQLYALHDT